MEVRLEPSWRRALTAEFGKEYFLRLSEFVRREYTEGAAYPAQADIFRAFDLCPFTAVKVVILGQDPYHGEGQATGLAFGVNGKAALPPSLKNILKELESDTLHQGRTLIGQEKYQGRTLIFDRTLERWARQGVLLLNATLTVAAKMPGSHQNKGWEEFTDAAIKALSDQKEHMVFILWGNYAKHKGAHIDRSKHLVIESPHPSPFSAHRGFFGSRPFSRANAYLEKTGQMPIDWRYSS